MNHWIRFLTRQNWPELLRYGSLYPQNTLTCTHIHFSSPTFSKISSFATNSVNPLSPKPNMYMNQWTRLVTRPSSPELLLRFGSLYPQKSLITSTHIHSSSPRFSKIRSFATNSVKSSMRKLRGVDSTGKIAVSGVGKPDRGKLPEELSRNVVVLTCESTAKGRSCYVYLIGTNHVSQESSKKVQALIRFLKPQVVFLEFCSKRMKVLTHNSKGPTMGDMTEIAKAFKEYFQAIYDSEVCVAFEEARAYGGKVVLGDRPAEIALKRTWGKMPLRHKIKLVGLLSGTGVLPSYKTLKRMLKVLDDVDITDKSTLKKLVKEMYNVDMTDLIQEMSKEFPTLMETFFHERDRYMSSKLLEVASKHSSVVAVVEEGHLPGIKKHWKQPVEREILEIPSQKAGVSAIKVITSLGVAAIIKDLIM